MKIKDDCAIGKIVAIENQVVSQYMEGSIRKTNIRQYEIDKIKIEECFLPGDIIKGKVVTIFQAILRNTQKISFGDSRKIYIGTGEDDLGVIFS